ncbi:MAG: OmpA family protein [Bryobacterales bacterium]|nr:OmpA family protein [Bryobacterales bacterium]
MPQHSTFRLLALVLVGAATACAQGLTTTATKDDWEEINFAFDRAVLTDGYPSLLRLAELLQKHPEYRVRLIGHADHYGPDPYNEKLGRARAQAVKDFLVKYGARDNQIAIESRGERQPKVSGQTREGRWMNRRVEVIVTDAQGRTISAAGIGEAIKAIEASELKKIADCCESILRKLDRLDEILALLKDLKAENEKLKQQIAALERAQAEARKQVTQLAEPPRPPSTAEIAQVTETAARKVAEEAKPSRFALLGLNIGPALNESLFTPLGRGNLTFSGRGRYFAPFGKTQAHALQAEGEYLYYRDRQEGQFDLGLVNRFRRAQLGLFSSFKHVSLLDLGGGTLGQAALTVDYLFGRGRFGMFGTKGYLDNRVIARRPVNPTATIWEESYLKIVDQIGASATVGAWKDAYFDANFGALFRRGGANRPGGMVRLVQPINEQWAFTVEAGLNETMVGAKNTGRLAVGLQFGNWLRPKQYLEVQHPVPVEIPRLRYELLRRYVRAGNSIPVADAGPDQIGVPAGAIRLDGSGSYDPDGDPLTYEWTQLAGPAVSLTGKNTPIATFTAAEGQSYRFRLTVKDPQGASASAAVTVTTAAPLPVRIVRFTANPSTIRAGQSATLFWQIENAESAEISGIGRVDPRTGTTTVAPTRTTEYRLTARNRTSEVSETVVVIVEQPQVRILSFYASPATITEGESSTLYWQTENAESVTISGIGAVATSGSTAVSPSRTTTYTLTARNPHGEASAQLTVQVTPGALPRIVRFGAAPPEIVAGETSNLFWVVENADEVTISGIGRVETAGSREVAPATTTTYTLTARNRRGEVTATAVVAVTPRVRILSFTARPTEITPGMAVVLDWSTENAVSAFISGVGPVAPTGFTIVYPRETTTFVLTAIGNRSQETARVTVTVTRPTPPPPPTEPPKASPPIAVAASQLVTIFPQLVLNGSGSFDPAGGPVSYSWRTLHGKALISNPSGPMPVVYLLDGFGEYIFELTVTNRSGLSASTRVTVTYIVNRLWGGPI